MKELKDNQDIESPFKKLRIQRDELEEIIKKKPINREQKVAIREAKGLLKKVSNLLRALGGL